MLDFFEIEVKNPEGKVTKTLKVKRVKRSQLNDLIELQKDLLCAYIKHNASVGAVITDEAVWHTMESVAAMLPIVGQKNPGLALEEIEDDFETLRTVFFNQNNMVKGIISFEDGNVLPSKISELHQLDYQGDWGKMGQRAREEVEAASEADKKRLEEEMKKLDEEMRGLQEETTAKES